MEKRMTDRCLLLVEDNEDDVFLMRRALKEAGIKNPLQLVEDGQAAIDYLEGNGAYRDRTLFPMPALIFLDLNLPIKSGFDVLAWIRRQELDTVVVVLSASDEPDDLQRAYKLGANSYVMKPPTAEQLNDLALAFKWYWLKHNQFETA
jgi:CheY-like chemotaxis protein